MDSGNFFFQELLAFRGKLCSMWLNIQKSPIYFALKITQNSDQKNYQTTVQQQILVYHWTIEEVLELGGRLALPLHIHSW